MKLLRLAHSSYVLSKWIHMLLRESGAGDYSERREKWECKTFETNAYGAKGFITHNPWLKRPVKRYVYSSQKQPSRQQIILF